MTGSFRRSSVERSAVWLLLCVSRRRCARAGASCSSTRSRTSRHWRRARFKASFRTKSGTAGRRRHRCPRSASRRRRLRVTDRSGRFEMRTLSPGPYLLRAHLSAVSSRRAVNSSMCVRACAHVRRRSRSAVRRRSLLRRWRRRATGVGPEPARWHCSAAADEGDHHDNDRRRSRRSGVATASRAPRHPEGRDPARRHHRRRHAGSISGFAGGSRARHASVARSTVTNLFGSTRRSRVS